MRASGFLLWALLAGGAVLAAPVDGDTRLTFSRFGRDGGGASVEQVFDLLPDGTFTWRAASVGAPCPSEGGTFLGTAPPDARRRLVEAATRLASDQKPRGEGPRVGDGAPGLITNTLELYRGVEVQTVALVEYTPAWEAFDARAVDIKGNAQPRAAVNLSAKRVAKGEVEVTFRHLGTVPLEIVLPRNAPEAFSVGQGHVRYKTPPVQMRRRLDSSKPAFSVVLIVPVGRAGSQTSSEIWYRNSAVLHHASPARQLKGLRPQALALCARYQ